MNNNFLSSYYHQMVEFVARKVTKSFIMTLCWHGNLTNDLRGGEGVPAF